MTLFSFQRELENSIGRKLHVKIKDGHSTMLSVKWEPTIKLSLHPMFLEAPRNIMDELACYLRRGKNLSPNIKAFIEDNLRKFDYRHKVDTSKLYAQGNVYNLKQIYNSINGEYFNKSLDLNITWYGKPLQRNRSRVTFGLYHEPLKLIKIHRLLDSPTCPDYVVSYVVYHEMLHEACPPYLDEKGVTRAHGKEFKLREKEFRHFDLAQRWIKDHQCCFFLS